MRTKNKLQGFTLVELLVVITIIGILAVGAVSMFTGAQQKARDSVRITDIQSLRTGLDLYYGDFTIFPAATTAEVGTLLVSKGYINKLPSEPKIGQCSKVSKFSYTYGAADDTNNVQAQLYEVSTTFENQANLDTKAINTADSGNDGARFEMGLNTSFVNSTPACTTTCGCTTAVAATTNKYKGTAATAIYELP